MAFQIPIYIKEPGAEIRKDYDVDWSRWLNEGDYLTGVTWTVPTGLTNDGESLGNTVAKIFLSGGVDQTDYTVLCQITTNDTLGDEYSFTVRVLDRHKST